MIGWRLSVGLLLLLTIGLPLAAPFIELSREEQAWRVWMEAPRLARLADHTARLLIGTLSLSLPAGIVGAVLLYRTDLPCRRFLHFLTVLALFVPLPLFAAAWQAALGSGGWLPLPSWSTPAPGDPDVSPAGTIWKPWAQGIGAAVWIHAVAGLPWIVLIVGQGLCWVEADLEEDALTVVGPWRVLWHVTLPSARAAIGAAAVWVGLQTATEITITDMLQVRTFAEEVYYQFVLGDRAALARSVAASLPMVLVTGALVLWASARLERRVPALAIRSTPLLYPLGRSRWICFVGVSLVVGLWVGVPLASLVWKIGLQGYPATWSYATAEHHFSRTLATQGRMVAESVLLAGGAGAITSFLALLVGWQALDSRVFRRGMLGLMALAWSLPAPVIGIGLKETINLLMDAEGKLAVLLGANDLEVTQQLLYLGPSPLPVLWASVVRFFPYAVAILWPMLRLLPVEVREAAQVDGASPGQELRYIIGPLMMPLCLWAGLAVAILALGELGAGKLVETPGSRMFAHELFAQMHYGVSNDLAAMCLVLLMMVGLMGSVLILLGWWMQRR